MATRMASPEKQSKQTEDKEKAKVEEKVIKLKMLQDYYTKARKVTK